MSIKNLRKNEITQVLSEKKQDAAAQTPLLPQWKLDRLESTNRIFELALLGRSRACKLAANLIFSINNGLPFSLSDLIYFDSTNLQHVRTLLMSIEAFEGSLVDWLEEGGYDGHNAYWAVRDEWPELFESLRKASRKMAEYDD